MSQSDFTHVVRSKFGSHALDFRFMGNTNICIVSCDLRLSNAIQSDYITIEQWNNTKQSWMCFGLL